MQLANIVYIKIIQVLLSDATQATKVSFIILKSKTDIFLSKRTRKNSKLCLPTECHLIDQIS